MDLLLNRGTGDLVFQNGACPVVTQKEDVVIQRLYIRLRTWQEEWFLNVQYGVPYDSILGMKVSKSTVDGIIQDQIYAEDGVLEITKFSSSMNSKRGYSCSFQVRTGTGLSDTIVINPGKV